jgi:adenylate cyclase class 2
MYEVELKLRSEHEPVRDRLAAIGATPTERVAQTDTYYSVPHRDFESTDESLRIRREEILDQSNEAIDAYITYKGPLVEQESKTRREEETAVEDSETIQSILEALGFTLLPRSVRTGANKT